MMLRTTISKIKRVCANAFMPRIIRGSVVCSSGKFEKFTKDVILSQQRRDKSTDDHNEEPRENISEKEHDALDNKNNERNKIIDKIFNDKPFELEPVKEKEAADLTTQQDLAQLYIDTVPNVKFCKKRRQIDQNELATSDELSVKDRLQPNSRHEKVLMQEESYWDRSQVDVEQTWVSCESSYRSDVPGSFHTGAAPSEVGDKDEIKLVQKLERIEEIPLVEAGVYRLEEYAKSNTNKTDEPANFNLDEVAKRCLKVSNTEIDEMLLKEMEKIGVSVIGKGEKPSRDVNKENKENIAERTKPIHLFDAVIEKDRKTTEKLSKSDANKTSLLKSEPLGLDQSQGQATIQAAIVATSQTANLNINRTTNQITNEISKQTADQNTLLEKIKTEPDKEKDGAIITAKITTPSKNPESDLPKAIETADEEKAQPSGSIFTRSDKYSKDPHKDTDNFITARVTLATFAKNSTAYPPLSLKRSVKSDDQENVQPGGSIYTRSDKYSEDDSDRPQQSRDKLLSVGEDDTKAIKNEAHEEKEKDLAMANVIFTKNAEVDPLPLTKSTEPIIKRGDEENPQSSGTIYTEHYKYLTDSTDKHQHSKDTLLSVREPKIEERGNTRKIKDDDKDKEGDFIPAKVSLATPSKNSEADPSSTKKDIESIIQSYKENFQQSELLYTGHDKYLVDNADQQKLNKGKLLSVGQQAIENMVNDEGHKDKEHILTMKEVTTLSKTHEKDPLLKSVEPIVKSVEGKITQQSGSEPAIEKEDTAIRIKDETHKEKVDDHISVKVATFSEKDASTLPKIIEPKGVVGDNIQLIESKNAEQYPSLSSKSTESIVKSNEKENINPEGSIYTQAYKYSEDNKGLQQSKDKSIGTGDVKTQNDPGKEKADEMITANVTSFSKSPKTDLLPLSKGEHEENVQPNGFLFSKNDTFLSNEAKRVQSLDKLPSVSNINDENFDQFLSDNEGSNFKDADKKDSIDKEIVQNMATATAELKSTAAILNSTTQQLVNISEELQNTSKVLLACAKLEEESKISEKYASPTDKSRGGKNFTTNAHPKSTIGGIAAVAPSYSTENPNITSKNVFEIDKPLLDVTKLDQFSEHTLKKCSLEGKHVEGLISATTLSKFRLSSMQELLKLVRKRNRILNCQEVLSSTLDQEPDETADLQTKSTCAAAIASAVPNIKTNSAESLNKATEENLVPDLQESPNKQHDPQNSNQSQSPATETPKEPIDSEAPKTVKFSCCDLNAFRNNPQSHYPSCTCQIAHEIASLAQEQPSADLTEEVILHLRYFSEILGATYQQGSQVLEALLLGKTRHRSKFYSGKDYTPWAPLPSWPYPKKIQQKKLQCPKDGSTIPPGSIVSDKPCGLKPATEIPTFPKRKFSILDVVTVRASDHHIGVDLGEF